MARAFIASVPLAIVLFAALVVPLTVIPGTFGFQGWPKSLGDKVSEHQVQVAPAPPTVAIRERKSHPAAAPPRGHVSKAPARRANRAAAKPTPLAGPAPRTAQHVNGPHGTVVVLAPHGSGPGPNQSSTPDAPAQTPAAPPEQPAPAPAPVGPSTVPTPDTVASEAPPTAREDPAANPVTTPPPAPVVEVVAQQPSDQGEDGSPGNSGHGHGHGRGLALGHLLGHAHGHGHSDDHE